MRRKRFLKAAMGIESLEHRQVLSTCTWTGAVDSSWGTPGNWNTAPGAGDTLVFPASAVRYNMVNDLASGLSLAGLRFDGSGYSLSGNQISLTDTLQAAQGSGKDVVSLPINFSGFNTIDVLQSAAELDLAGALSSPGTLTKTGTGTLLYTNAITFTGNTQVASGTLVNNANLNGDIFLGVSSTLNGQGTSNALTSTGGTIIPGSTGIGLIQAGSLSLDTNSNYFPTINDTYPGTGYGQIRVTGPVNLGNAMFYPSLGTFDPGITSFTVVDNRGTGPVQGIFKGLPEGTVFDVSGEPIRITYFGGDGNDVVVYHQVDTQSSLTISTANLVYGQPVTLNAHVSTQVPNQGTPAGNVTFYEGGNLLGSAALDAAGNATLTSANLPLGNYGISAIFEGFEGYSSSTSNAEQATVTAALTNTSLSSSSNPSVLGQKIDLTATVAANAPSTAIPTGQVQFYNGSTLLGNATLDTSGHAVLANQSFPLGNASLSVRYAGDTNFIASNSSAVTQVVTQALANVTLSAITLNPDASGLITLTAKVAAAFPGQPVPTGSVSFYANDVLLETANLVGGMASYSNTGFGLGIGVDQIVAKYSGDTTYTHSDSANLTVTAGTANERFVNQAYLVIFYRQADYQGLNARNSYLQHGRTRTWLATMMRRSSAGQAALIQNIFTEYLGRTASSEELAGTVADAKATRTSPRAIVLGSREYYNGTGGGSIPTYLKAMETTLGVTFSNYAFKKMTAQLTAGVLRAKVANQALLSPAGLNSLGQSLYQQTYGRAATDTEIASFKRRSNSGIYWRTQQVQIIGSKDFFTYAINQPGVEPV